MKKFLVPIVLAASLLFMSFVETGIRQECRGNHRHAPDAALSRRCGAPFSV